MSPPLPRLARGRSVGSGMGSVPALDIEFTAFVPSSNAGANTAASGGATPLPSSPVAAQVGDAMEDAPAAPALIVKDVLMKAAGSPNGGLWPYMLHDAAQKIVPQVSAQQWNAYARYEVRCELQSALPLYAACSQPTVSKHT